MILRKILITTTLLFGSNLLDAGLWDQVTTYFSGNKSSIPMINVLLVHDLEGTNLEIKGKYSLFDPYANSYISSRYIGKSKYMKAAPDGLNWGESFPGIYQLKIRPDEETTVAVVENKEFPGYLYIYDIGGSISIINQVSVEDYVRSILSNLDIGSLHSETISALAIAIRTNAYYQAANPKTSFWATDAKKVGYTGLPKPTSNTTLADEAVRVTKNMTMSRTGVYEGIATPFAADFGPIKPMQMKDMAISKLSLEDANKLAQEGDHAAQILSKAFPGTTIMLNQ